MNGFYDLSSLKSLLADTLREKSCGYIIEEIFSRFPSVTELLDATDRSSPASRASARRRRGKSSPRCSWRGC